MVTLKNSIPFIYEQKSKILIFRFLIISGLVFWIYGFLMPLVSNIQNPFISFLMKNFYSTVCHQESFKCIAIENHSMLVCSRCAGIYIGAFTASMVSLFLITPELRLRIFFTSSIPLVIDVILTTTGVYEYSQLGAFLTGFIFGSTLYLFIMAELEKFIITKEQIITNE